MERLTEWLANCGLFLYFSSVVFGLFLAAGIGIISFGFFLIGLSKTFERFFPNRGEDRYVKAAS